MNFGGDAIQSLASTKTFSHVPSNSHDDSEVVPVSSPSSRWRHLGLQLLSNIPRITRLISGTAWIQTQMCVICKECGRFFKSPTGAEASPLPPRRGRHRVPWLLTAGCLNQNQEGGCGGSSRAGGGQRQRKACVFVHVLVPKKGKWFFRVWFLAELLFEGGGVWWANHQEYHEDCYGLGEGTMTGLYFSACLCDFIINVSESDFYSLHLSIWPSQAPSLPPHPVTASSSIQLSPEQLHLLWEAFPDSLRYLTILCIFWTSNSSLLSQFKTYMNDLKGLNWFCIDHTVSW